MPAQVQQTIATHLQMPIVTDLGKYLGMPLLTTRKTNNAFSPLVDRINNKIRHWQSKLLSQAGRLRSSNLFYHHQAITRCKLLFFQEEFLILQTSQFVTFFGGIHQHEKHVHLLAWETVTKTKSSGGLGIRDTKYSNDALLINQAWCL